MATPFDTITETLKSIDVPSLLSAVAGEAKTRAQSVIPPEIARAMRERDLRTLWDSLAALPGGSGSRVFDMVAKVIVPHAARMGFHVVRLDDVSMTATLPDRRSNRNHLQSLHAMALAHLGEFTSGVLCLYAVSPGYRTILTKFEIEYLAKARGTITARARFTRPKGSLDGKDVEVPVEMVDRSGRVVARSVSTWRVGALPGYETAKNSTREKPRKKKKSRGNVA